MPDLGADLHRVDFPTAAPLPQAQQRPLPDGATAAVVRGGHHRRRVSCKKKVIADPLNCLNNAHVQATCPSTCLKHGYVLPCQLVAEARRLMALEAAARYERAHEGAESDEATEALEEAAA